uniref:Uncharacterized protein n=1 Tax=Zea mays TaxID=4577 RepID=C0PB73_MAIZE|nr:unknown [Zea mays]
METVQSITFSCRKCNFYRGIILQLLMPKPTKLNHHSWYDTGTWKTEAKQNRNEDNREQQFWNYDIEIL